MRIGQWVINNTDPKRRPGQIVGFDHGLIVVQFDGLSRPTKHSELRIEPMNLWNRRKETQC